METAGLDTGRKLPIKQLLREEALNLSTHFDIEENRNQDILFGLLSSDKWHLSFLLKS